MSDVISYTSLSPLSGAVGGFWARGFGQFGKLDCNSGALGSSYSTGGGIIGADVVSNPRAVLGFAVSGGESSVSLNTNPENGTIQFFQGGIYGACEPPDNGLVVDGAMIYAHDIYDITRGIVLPGISRTASSNHGGEDEVAALGVGRTFFYQDLRVLPRARGVVFPHRPVGLFWETGAGSLDLSVSSRRPQRALHPRRRHGGKAGDARRHRDRARIARRLAAQSPRQLRPVQRGLRRRAGS